MLLAVLSSFIGNRKKNDIGVEGSLEWEERWRKAFTL